MLQLELLENIRELTLEEQIELKDLLKLKWFCSNPSLAIVFESACSWVKTEKQRAIKAGLGESTEMSHFLAHIGKALGVATYKRDTYNFHQKSLRAPFARYIETHGRYLENVDRRFNACNWWISKQNRAMSMSSLKALGEEIGRQRIGPTRYRLEFEAAWLGLQVPAVSGVRNFFDEFDSFGAVLDNMYIAFKLKFLYAEWCNALVMHRNTSADRLQWQRAYLEFIGKQLQGRLVGHQYLRGLYDLCLVLEHELAGRLGGIENRTLNPETIHLLEIPILINEEQGRDGAYVSNQPSIAEMRDYCTGWLGIYFDRILRGSGDFVAQAFQMYRYMVRHDLLIDADGKVDIYHLKNLVKLGSELGEYGVVEAILSNAQDSIPATLRSNVMDFLRLLVVLNQLTVTNVNRALQQILMLKEKWKGSAEDRFFKLDLDVGMLKAELWRAIHIPESFQGADETRCIELAEALRKKVNDYKSIVSPSFEIAYRKFALTMRFVFENRPDWEQVTTWKSMLTEKINAAPYCMERHWLKRCW